MKENLNKDIKIMHKKFGVHDWVDDKHTKGDYETLQRFLKFRTDFIQEELDETVRAIKEKNPEEVVDGLIDILVVALGTLDAFRVDVDEAWNQVKKANMSKEVGIKESRPNPLGLPDLIKPENWHGPDHKGNVGILGATLYDDYRCNCYSCYMMRGYNV